MMPFGSQTGSNNVITSPSRDHPMALDNDRSGVYHRHSAGSPSPPQNVMFAQSPPNMEGPVAFVAPCLAEETLMDVSEITVRFSHYSCIMSHLLYFLFGVFN